MSVQQIDRSGWSPFFDSFTRTLSGMRAEVEVASLDVGDQITADRAPLIGITYDDRDNLVEIALGGVDRLVYEPAEIYVDYDVGGLIALEIIASDGTRQIIKLKDPLALPPPERTEAGAAG
ncbi:MAG: uncharacterized protein JWN69_1875 [Alphaproteobacteria bacterium]|nr:uncharacterized protein [Alphaproteobacteria bacterium]